MTAEDKSDHSSKRPIILSPGLVVLGALLLYGFTLNHWVTLSNLPIVSEVTGWDWHPLPLPWRQHQFMPLFFILTCPVRLLPGTWQPAALNIFAAICAALTLGILAATVRLLPHDRTKEQRQREGGEFSLLSVRAAFLPALFAVLMLGLQLTFWRNAISASGEMLDVLVFAFLIFCLLKFRISQNDKWLAGFALVYGLGVTNNWALIGFFPFFLIAVVWIKGVNFFNWRFLGRLAGCGILGLLLYLLMPVIGSLSSERANFLSLLHMELGSQTFGLRLVPRWIAMVAALPTLLPLFFAGICWPSFEGEVSASGNAMTKFMFRLLHVVFLLLALILFFDFKYSPGLRLQEAPIGFLTFYYMGALCIGYFSGYVLLVFGKPSSQTWDRQGSLARAFNLVVVGLCWLLAVAATGGLIYQNFPHINAGKNNAVADFSGEILRDLPAKPVIILSDDPWRLNLLEASYRREGKPNKNILIDTGSLPHQEYIAYLVSRYPEQLKKLTKPPDKLPPVLSSKSLMDYVHVLGLSYPIYYLQPSFGYYFEVFYMKPHGLVYELQIYPKDALEAPLSTSQEIKENQDIWARLEKKSLADLPPMAKLDPDTAMICDHFSVDLDCWGVYLQKAGHLKEANAQFAEAVRLNPQNFIAKINKEYNDHLQKNDHRPIDIGDLVFKAINLYKGMVPILKFNGPPDEPGVDLDFGTLMAEGHVYRQAAIFFNRCLQLQPDDANATLALAKTFVDWGLPDKALELVRKLRANPASNKWEVSRVEALAYYAKHDFPAAEKLLLSGLKENPHDENRVALMAEFYRLTAYTALRDANEASLKKNSALYAKDANEANRRFTNALAYIDQEVQSLMLASRGSADPYGVPETLLKKAEVEMMLKSFAPSITTLTEVIERQPNNPTAVLNRAIAETQVNKLQEAKADYQALRKLLPQQLYVVYFGLADVANREKDRAEEIRCLKLYLQSAPKENAEYSQVTQRLKKLESP